MKRTMHSKVMTIANRLVKQGYNRANAMVKAWVLVKLPNICTKVAGVTYGNANRLLNTLHTTAPNTSESVFTVTTQTHMTATQLQL